MIKKIYDRDTGNIYDVGGSERKVLTIDDINPEVINEHPDLIITLNDRDYNNTHIVIDWLEVVNKYIDDTYTYFDNVNVYLSEQTKNCTIQIINIPGKENKGMSINGGKTICLIPIMYQNVIIDYVGLNYYASYSDNSITDYTNGIGVCQCEEYNNSIIGMIGNVDAFGNVVVKVIHNFEY